MTKKELFISYIEMLIDEDTNDILNSAFNEEEQKMILTYFEALKITDTQKKDKPMFTDNGKLVIKYLQQSGEMMLKARDIADAISLSSRQVSGAMRKLITDGYVEKNGQNPVVYSITEKGKEIDIEN